VRAFGGDDIVTLVAGGQIVFLVCGAILVSAHGLFLPSAEAPPLRTARDVQILPPPT